MLISLLSSGTSLMCQLSSSILLICQLSSSTLLICLLSSSTLLTCQLSSGRQSLEARIELRCTRAQVHPLELSSYMSQQHQLRNSLHELSFHEPRPKSQHLTRNLQDYQGTHGRVTNIYDISIYHLPNFGYFGYFLGILSWSITTVWLLIYGQP